MFLKSTSMIAALVLAAGPALAGSVTPPPADPVIQPTPVPYASSPDWTGFYAGGQLGYGNIDTNVAGVDGDGLIGGMTAGYDYDFGQFVAGAGLDYDWTDISLAPGVDVDRVWRAKLRGGYKLGNGLLYATAGYANVDVSTVGDDDGYFAGAGYEHMISDQFSVGGELLYHEFDTINGTAIDAEATTAQLRGVFRF